MLTASTHWYLTRSMPVSAAPPPVRWQVYCDLAATHQVIVVTHLAQVAVMADKHYVVSKEPGDVPQTHLDEVTGAARIAEIARMLSGDQSELEAWPTQSRCSKKF